MSVAIRIENLSKQYRLGLVSTNTISHDLNRWWKMNICGKEDPYLKIGEANDRTKKGESDYVWALKDINLDIEEGDVLGIIGKNGAGKSTLLKILSKVTAPTTGYIKARGHIASLLEVGTGFHQEMTGKENIFLNGAILGMSKDEIKGKLDGIIDFAGVERYLDTPVKRYSSGMIVRLGFAVAAFMDPEILVVDEVLAVGDAEFQKKAIGKMKEVSTTQGRTVLFVSHNMGAVKDLCTRGVLLNNGQISYSGQVEEVIEKYLTSDGDSATSKWERTNDSNNEISFSKIEITDCKKQSRESIGSGESFLLNIHFASRIRSSNIIFAVQFSDVYGNPIITTSNSDYRNKVEPVEIGEFVYCIDIQDNIFMPGTYYITVACFESGRKLYDILENKLTIRIEDMGLKLYNRDSKGVVHRRYRWEIR